MRWRHLRGRPPRASPPPAPMGRGKPSGQLRPVGLRLVLPMKRADSLPLRDCCGRALNAPRSCLAGAESLSHVLLHLSPVPCAHRYPRRARGGAYLGMALRARAPQMRTGFMLHPASAGLHPEVGTTSGRCIRGLPIWINLMSGPEACPACSLRRSAPLSLSFWGCFWGLYVNPGNLVRGGNPEPSSGICL